MPVGIIPTRIEQKDPQRCIRSIMKNRIMLDLFRNVPLPHLQTTQGMVEGAGLEEYRMVQHHPIP
jgi:hypothetical protein